VYSILYTYISILYILNARINCNHRGGLIIGKKVSERDGERGVRERDHWSD